MPSIAAHNHDVFWGKQQPLGGKTPTRGRPLSLNEVQGIVDVEQWQSTQGAV